MLPNARQAKLSAIRRKSFVLTLLMVSLDQMKLFSNQRSDHTHLDQHPEVRVLKDMAAGAVLLACFSALVIGLLLLLVTF